MLFAHKTQFKNDSHFHFYMQNLQRTSSIKSGEKKTFLFKHINLLLQLFGCYFSFFLSLFWQVFLAKLPTENVIFLDARFDCNRFDALSCFFLLNWMSKYSQHHSKCSASQNKPKTTTKAMKSLENNVVTNDKIWERMRRERRIKYGKKTKVRKTTAATCAFYATGVCSRVKVWLAANNRCWIDFDTFFFGFDVKTVSLVAIVSFFSRD